MADLKHERILDTLKQRITQLEHELRESTGRLHSALEQNEESKKEMDLLRTEAHDVVGQWEKEATDVRRKLEASHTHVTKLTASLWETAAAKEQLVHQVESLEKISGDYSASVRAQQDQIAGLETEKVEAAAHLAKSQREFAEAMQQIKEYEELTVAMQRELQSLTETHGTTSAKVESLKKALAQAADDLSRTRAHKDEISAHAEKLLRRISELKSLNDQLCDDTQITQQHSKAHLVELENVKMLLVEETSQRKQFEAQLVEVSAEKERLSAEVVTLTTAVENTEGVSQQQLEIISGLERDVQELQDAGIVQGKFLEEFQQQKDILDNELAAAVKGKEEADAQFGTIKECYSSTLMEANEYKMKAEAARSDVQHELEQYRTVMTEALAFSDQRGEAALESVKHLRGALQSAQLRELLLSEQHGRSDVTLAAQQDRISSIHAFSQDCASHARTLEILLANNTSEFGTVMADKAAVVEKYGALSMRMSAADEELTQLRKSFAALESKAAKSAAEGKTLEEQNAALQRDNEWLKDQVKAMRTDLGDLDELLNANLNQMQEENEKLSTANHSLQATIDELRTSESSSVAKIAQYQENFSAMENEFAAQSKTLDVAEADLRAANEDIDKLQNTVARAMARVEDAEQRISELSRNNALLATQNHTMKEQMRGQEERLNIIVADKRREVDALRVKMNQCVNKSEQFEAAMLHEKQVCAELEKALSTSKDGAAKMRAALEEVKERCASDATSLKQLISERDELLRDRDVIVERYNRLHDAFRNAKRETNGKVADELRKMLDFSSRQESELQQLRRENITLKKSVSMFVTSAKPEAEAIFTERLNLTEGAIRHPKKRSVPKTVEQPSQ